MHAALPVRRKNEPSASRAYCCLAGRSRRAAAQAALIAWTRRPGDQPRTPVVDASPARAEHRCWDASPEVNLHSFTGIRASLYITARAEMNPCLK